MAEHLTCEQYAFWINNYYKQVPLHQKLLFSSTLKTLKKAEISVLFSS